jgi:predicted MFS family arabinose efflux permease
MNWKDMSLAQKIATIIAGLAVLVTGIVVAIFMREAPKENNEPRVDAPKKKKRSDRWCGVEFFKISRMTIFYLSLVCIFLTGFCLQGITGIAKAHMRDVGLDAEFVAYALSFHSVSLACFKFLTGVIYDKFGLRVATSTCCSVAVVVIFLLSIITNSTVGMVIAFIYSIFSALALPLETIMLPIYAADLFGEASYEKILGLFVSVNVLGYAFGVPAVNLCYDLIGTYTPILLATSVIMLVVTVIMQFVITKANGLKRDLTDDEEKRRIQ